MPASCMLIEYAADTSVPLTAQFQDNVISYDLAHCMARHGNPASRRCCDVRRVQVQAAFPYCRSVSSGWQVKLCRHALSGSVRAKYAHMIEHILGAHVVQPSCVKGAARSQRPDALPHRSAVMRCERTSERWNDTWLQIGRTIVCAKPHSHTSKQEPWRRIS